MKKLLLLLVLLLVTAFQGFSQTTGISYQAVILNPKGGPNAQNNILANSTVTIQFTVVNATGTEEYKEKHTTNTDRYGMVNLLIGSGTPTSSSNFAAIVWNGTTKKLKVGIDFSGGSNFSPLSEQNLTYMPHPPTAEVTNEITKNSAAISTLKSEQIAQNNAIALNNAKVGISGAQATTISNTSGINTGDQDGSETKVIAGTNVTITGLGTTIQPYVLNSIIDVGSTGLQGIQGETGIQGPIGETGATGARGVQGIQGEIGLTGPQGPEGDQGDKGEIGITGPLGIDGKDGAAGAIGAIGPEGPIGLQGPDGATGSQGIQGIAGNAGAIGATGPQGIQGIVGQKGDQGDKGEIGLTGVQGEIGLTGKGDIGITGPQGIDGNDGAAGPEGIQGIAGNDGAIGATGLQGIVGPAGADGLDGATGPAGADGNSIFSTTDLAEGTNLYYTEIRVSANTAVVANTAKTGITAQQASEITVNNAKVGITPTQSTAIATNATAISTLQREQTMQNSAIALNTAKIGITKDQADAIELNTAKTGYPITSGNVFFKVEGIPITVEFTREFPFRVIASSASPVIIVSMGLCWSTNMNATINDNRTIENVPYKVDLPFAVETTITGLMWNTVYYVRPYAIDSEGLISYGREVTQRATRLRSEMQQDLDLKGITTLLAEGMAIEEFYGLKYLDGYIAYLTKQGTGFVVSLDDSGTVIWYNVAGSTTATTSYLIGDGGSNTNNILAATDEHYKAYPSTQYYPYAAIVARRGVIKGLNLWFLPSPNELLAIYNNLFLKGFGNFSANESYWSSKGYTGSILAGPNDDPGLKAVFLKFDGKGVLDLIDRSSVLRVRSAKAF